MEKFSRAIASYLASKNAIRKEDINIYQYGLQVGMETCFSIICGIVIAILCSMEMETVVFLIVFFMLRSYAGGLHLNTYLGCLVCSCMSQLGLLLLVRYVNVNRSVSVAMIVCSFIYIRCLSPVQDVNRPLSREEKELFGKKLMRTLVAIGLFSLILYLGEQEKLLFTVAVTSLLTVIVLVLGKIKYSMEEKICAQKEHEK